MKVVLLGRGYAWLDTGTHDSLIDASSFIQTIESRQGLKVACLEEIAYKNRWIDDNDLKIAITKYNKSGYGSYLERILNEGQ